MRRRRIALPVILVLAAGTLFVSTSASRVAPVVSSPAAGAQDEETKLEGIMEGIRADMKAIGKQIGSKDQDAAWKTVCSLQKHLLDAKQEIPKKAASVPEAERPAFVRDFRAKIAAFLKATCDLETAVLGGKFDEADKVYNDVIWPMQKPAHHKFRND